MFRASEAKKLVSVSATSTSTTGAREEVIECIPCIYYLVQFKNIIGAQVQALVDSRSEVNVIYLTFAKHLGLPIRPTDVGAQKIDGTTLDAHRMIVAAFAVEDKANQVRFFENIFLLANVSLKVVDEMPFLTLSGADIDFLGRELRCRTYTTDEVLLITRRVKLVGKKKFAIVAIDPEYETYVVRVVYFSLPCLSRLSISTLPKDLRYLA